MNKMMVIDKTVVQFARGILVLTSSLLAACGGGGGSSVDPTVEPPRTVLALPALISTVDGVEVNARDALNNVPGGYSASDVRFSLAAYNGSDADITPLQAGRWLVKPKVNAPSTFSLKLDIGLGSNTRSQILESHAYPDVDKSRQVLSLGAMALTPQIGVGETLTLPLQVRQVKTTASPGVTAQVFFSGTVWGWDTGSLVVADDKLVSGTVYQDSADLDNDSSTDYFVLFSWFNASSEGWGVPHDGEWHTLASLQFTRKTTTASTFRIRAKDKPVDQEVVTVPASMGAGS